MQAPDPRLERNPLDNLYLDAIVELRDSVTALRDSMLTPESV